jgi:GR25 family glycosyltransferase involved in LPS biosynthesis
MEHIDKIIYINMDARTDRRAELEAEFKRIGVQEDKILRFPASSYNGCPNSGCLASHANAIHLAYEMGYNNVLILEDDFRFIADASKVTADIDAFFDMNLDWDVLMLTTCSPVVVPEYVGYLVSRISSSTNGAGYLVNRPMMMELVELFDDNVENLFNTKAHWIYQNDILWKKLMPSKKWYMFNHFLGYQVAGYSDLSQDQKIAIMPQVLEVDNVLEWIESIQADYMKKHTYLEKLKNDIKNQKK